MILELFLLFLGLSIVGMLLGYFTEDKFFFFIGLFFLFYLSYILFSGGLQYTSGENTTNCNYNDIYEYGNNFTAPEHWDYSSLPVNTGNTVYVFHVERNYSNCVNVKTKTYTTIKDTQTTLLGKILAFGAGFGMILGLYNIRRDKKEAEK